MYLVLAALFLWSVSLLLLARVLWLGDQPAPCTGARLALCGLVLLAGVLFFRPHGEVFGGQDTGAYLNGSAAFAREGALSYEDEMLAQLPVEERAPFVISKHYMAKYHCLWLPDPTKPVMQTWFQPAFPVMAGLLTHVLPPTAVLYVIPFMALCVGLAVRALAGQLSRHPWAGNAAFVCYILNPLVVWHARHPRPEIIASFLLFGGAALLLSAWRAQRGTAWIDLLLGALCVTLAPFFHVTAWSVVITVGVLGVVAIIARRDDFLVLPAVACATLGGFLWQIFFVRDTYGLRRFVRPFIPYGWPLALAIIAGVAVLLVISRAVRRRMMSAPVGARADTRCAWAMFPRWVGATLILAAYLGVAWVAYRTSAEELKTSAGRFLYRTDLRCVVGMVSLSTALLGLAGLIVLATRPGPRSAARWALLLAFVPATLVIGNMFDFFMTRYMLVTVLPLLAVALSAIASLVPYTSWRKRLGFCYIVFLVCFLGLHGRTLLITHTNYKGFDRYIGRIAERIKSENGMLLCEYFGIAAPFDLLFGVSTLGLDNERQWDYRAAERAWLRIMRANPERPAFFATPFERIPVSDRFVFAPLGVSEYAGRAIYAPRWDFPSGAFDWGCGLRLYRMLPREARDTTEHAADFPWSADFGEGNMGLRGLDRPEREEGLSVPCVRLQPDQPIRIPLLSVDDETPSLVFLIVKRDVGSNSRPDVRLDIDGARAALSVEHLVNEWWLCRASVPTRTNAVPTRHIALYGDAGTSVSMVRAVHGDRVAPLFNAWQTEAPTLQPVSAFSFRWVPAGGAFLVPLPLGPSAHLLTFSLAPMEWGDNAVLQLRAGAGAPRVSAPVTTSGFAWELWPVQRDDPGRPVVPCAVTSTAGPSSGVGHGVTTMPVAIGHAVVVAD